ncbi:uncharacterized protein VP01_1702g6, partial [Puccinia sorghi]
MSDHKSLPILSATNFTSWKIKIKGYCMQHGLSKHLSATIPPAEPGKLETYKEQQLKVVGILHQMIGDTNYARFVTSTNEENPASIWNTLMSVKMK